MIAARPSPHRRDPAEMVSLLPQIQKNWEDADDQTGTLRGAAWPCGLGGGHHARLLLLGDRGGDHLSASPERRLRAAELADADGQLQQLESFDAQPDQPQQRRQSQGQVHGLARRSRSSQQGHGVFHAAGRGRLHVCGQPVAAILEVRRQERKADGGVEVRRQGPGRRAERPQRRAARQQHVLQHQQRHLDPAPGRARQEFRPGRVRRQHHGAGSRAQSGTLGSPARGEEHDRHRAGKPGRERPRLSRGLYRRHRKADLAVPGRSQSR